MKIYFKVMMLMLLFMASYSNAATTTYLVEVDQTSSFAQLDIVTFVDVWGRLEVGVSGEDIWFTNVSLTTDTAFNLGGFLLMDGVGSYAVNGFHFSYNGGVGVGSYSGSFDGNNLTLLTDGQYYSEIYGSVISVSNVPIPTTLMLFSSSIMLLPLISKLGKKS